MNVTSQPEIAANWIKNNKIIAYPTEGVWGIGGLYNETNINKIASVKHRPIEKNFILLFKSTDQLIESFEVENKYKKLIKNFEYKFITVLIPLESGQKIAARLPGYKPLKKFLEDIDQPIISTSANISGEQTCMNIEEIKSVFEGAIYGALDIELGPENKPSRILDLEKNEFIR